MDSLNTRRLVNVEYPKERLDEPEWRIYELCRKGIIPHVRIGRRVKFDPQAIEDWIRQGGAAA